MCLGDVMSLFALIACLFTLAAVFSYINFRYLGLPNSVGLMLLAFALSFSLIVLLHLGVDLTTWANLILSKIEFSEALMQGMLSFLLFASALQVNLEELWHEKWMVLLLSTIGMLFSTVIIGALAFLLLRFSGLALSFGYCLLFGSLISPTDPIAVLSLLRKMGAPSSLIARVGGESLFNDGMGIALFACLLPLALHGQNFSLLYFLKEFLFHTLGGVAFGFVAGWITYLLLKTVDDYEVEILLTLGLVSGGYLLASLLSVSAPIAVVVAGILIGNRGRMFAMSEKTRLHLDIFWDVTDQILNAILFVLIGLELLRLPLTVRYYLVGTAMIPLALISRWLSVGATLTLLGPYQEIERGTVTLLTWGGLRGGISIAMALSLPPSLARDVFVASTYAIVTFSIIIQGTTVKKFISHYVQFQQLS